MRKFRAHSSFQFFVVFSNIETDFQNYDLQGFVSRIQSIQNFLLARTWIFLAVIEWQSSASNKKHVCQIWGKYTGWFVWYGLRKKRAKIHKRSFISVTKTVRANKCGIFRTTKVPRIRLLNVYISKWNTLYIYQTYRLSSLQHHKTRNTKRTLVTWVQKNSRIWNFKG